MLDGQSLRAARVIIDIGMHLELTIPPDNPFGFHPGETWTPRLGRDFVGAHSWTEPAVLDFEVKRYLGWPGQAPSYKVGERIWLGGSRRGPRPGRRGLRHQGLPPRGAGPGPPRSRAVEDGPGAVVTVVLVLASASPARLATLRSAGVEPVVIVSGVDESRLDGLPPAELALQLAELKCATVAERDDVPSDALVLGCDSVLELDGEAHGKPADAEDAVRRWRRMRGRSGVLHSGHCLRDTADGRTAAATASTVVHFADLDDDEIAAYVATGEPLHVAGAFTIDGLGGAFVSGIEGDHHTVVGVSLPLLRELTAELGHRWTDLWDGPSR